MPFLIPSYNIPSYPEIDTNILLNGVYVDILRLDKIHAVASGNKLFKLSAYLREAVDSTHKTVLTFGGAFSNHLHATAYACSRLGLKSIGIVRGERQEINSDTMAECEAMGMHLEFCDRETFGRLSSGKDAGYITKRFGTFTLVPPGGYGRKGVQGASSILDEIGGGPYSHICVPVGTATTLAGLLSKERPEKILGFSAIKGLNDIDERLRTLQVSNRNFEILGDYHFGGFARISEELMQFMSHFYQSHSVPLDFVYTGKMMFGIAALTARNFFSGTKKILAIHTGGLQGNRSLPAGSLPY